MTRLLLTVALVAASACGSRTGAPAAPVPHAAGGTCPAGTQAYSAACGPGPEGTVAVEDGCYVSCDDGASCPSGTTCTTAWIHPCAPSGDDEPSCLACGGEARLCLEE